MRVEDLAAYEVLEKREIADIHSLTLSLQTQKDRCQSGADFQ